MTNATTTTTKTAPRSLPRFYCPIETRTTDAIWIAAHSALIEQRWSEARKELEALGRRTDVRDYLPSAEACGCPSAIRELIQDRIDMVHIRIQ